jgi:hypothetical protein
MTSSRRPEGDTLVERLGGEGGMTSGFTNLAREPTEKRCATSIEWVMEACASVLPRVGMVGAEGEGEAFVFGICWDTRRVVWVGNSGIPSVISSSNSRRNRSNSDMSGLVCGACLLFSRSNQTPAPEEGADILDTWDVCVICNTCVSGLDVVAVTGDRCGGRIALVSENMEEADGGFNSKEWGGVTRPETSILAGAAGTILTAPVARMTVSFACKRGDGKTTPWDGTLSRTSKVGP